LTAIDIHQHLDVGLPLIQPQRDNGHKAALEDEAYVERLRRHYQLFKQAIETEERPRRRHQKRHSKGKRGKLRLVKK
jgi:hypothetical protein